MKVLQLIAALSLLILIHEAGHFMWARIFGIRVEKFFLFFDAGGFKLLSTRQKWFLKLFPKAASWQTEYGIGWLPLGGYCKIAGMIDESMDRDFLSREAQPWEFRSHPAWQRLLVMNGGVLNNIILAIVIFSGLLSANGRSVIPHDSPVYVNELGEELGFRSGDVVLSFDGRDPGDFAMMQMEMARRGVRKVTVLRGSDTLDIYLDHSRIADIISQPGVFDLAMPFVVDSIPPYSINRASGLQKGDTLVAAANIGTPYIQDAKAVFADNSGGSIPATVLRGADTMSISLSVDTLGRVGVYLAPPELEHIEYTFAQAIPAGFALTWNNIKGYLRDLKMVATPSTGAYKSVGSFIAIGSIFPKVWDWTRFFNISAVLSIMLAVLNLLPIPALDGGHIVFCLYEMISGRKPSDRFLTIMQAIGMLLLLLLMILAFKNDITRLLRP